MIRFETRLRFLTQSVMPWRVVLLLSGTVGLLRLALLAGDADSLAQPEPQPAQAEAVLAAPPPLVELQPMSNRPSTAHVVTASWDPALIGRTQEVVPASWDPAPVSPTSKLRPLPDPAATVFEPAGCLAPPLDYGPVRAGPRMLSARTLSMLEHAANLYGGRLDITGEAILGSVRGGAEDADPDPEGEYGVVDLAVVSADGRVLYQEIDPLIRALRAAGFAAWLRDRGQFSPKSEAYLHAVAIGDRQLSTAARDQLTGPDGYFLGGEGLDPDAPTPDRHGGPVVCRWMRDPALADVRAAPLPISTRRVELSWDARLTEVAQAFITEDAAATAELARALDYLSSGQEDPSNMCGPLSAAILREAGLLPASVGPVANLKSYWLANPVTNGRPWSLFPADRYRVYHFDTGTDRFDFSQWPLMPGDFVYTYAGHGSFSHMFIVTEVDSDGRAYTVTNQLQRDGTYLVQQVLLYDPSDDEVGVLKSRCSECGSWRRRTGLGGFDVLRRRELDADAGSLVEHIVAPGETLPAIAAKYGTPMATLVGHNTIADPLALQVGSLLHLPVGRRPAEMPSKP